MKWPYKKLFQRYVTTLLKSPSLPLISVMVCNKFCCPHPRQALRNVWMIPYKAFFTKQKDLWNNSLCLNFCIIFEENNFSCYILTRELTRFHYLVAFTSWDIGQLVYCNCLFTRLWRHKFGIILIFLAIVTRKEKVPKKFLFVWLCSYQPIFSTWPKIQDKNLNILRTKRV